MIDLNFLFKRNPGKKGIVRLRTVSKDRLKNGQLVITPDGLGTIKEFMVKRDSSGRIESPAGLRINIRNIPHKFKTYKTSLVNVVDIIDDKTGTRYPASESDYNLLLVDQSKVDFLVSRKGKALLTDKSRKDLSNIKVFVKKQNGIKILNELIEKGLWPIKK
jgi:hypothetical protein